MASRTYYGRQGPDDWIDLNVHAYGRLVRNPDLEPEALVAEWAREKGVPEADHRTLAEILLRSSDLIAQGLYTLDFRVARCETVVMKNITVSIDADLHYRARIKAAEKGSSLSAIVRDFLIRFCGEETDYDRRKRLEREAFASIEAFRGRDRIDRDRLHDRDAFR